MPSYDPDTHYRLVLAGVFLVVSLITGICIHDSLAWIGRPFNGFLLGRNRIVAPIAQPSWPGAQAGIPYWSQVVAVDGVPVDSVGAVLGAAAAAGDGALLAYTFSTGAATMRVPVAVTTFTLTDYLGLFANYLFNGLAFLVLGFFVAFLRPRQKAAQAMLVFSFCWGFSLVLGLADFASFHFRELLAAAEASAPASLLYLTLCFPTEHALARRRGVVGGLLALSAVLAVLNIVLYDHAPRLWIVSYQLGLLWAAIAVVLAVGCMWKQYRNAASAIAREKIKIVFLGIIVAFAFPAAAFTAGKAIGAELPLNVLPAATWVFPAALAYAIVKRDLFEIDVFLRRAASYAALTAAVFLLYVAVVGLFSHGFHNLSLAASPWFTLLFSLAVLSIVRPLRDRVQTGVDRIFFRSQFDYVQITESLSQALTRTLETREVSAQVERAIVATMAPSFCRLLHVVGEERFRAAVGGAEVGLDAAVRVAVEAAGMRDAGHLPAPLPPPFDTAALVVALRFEGRLEGLLVLGAKNSGAAYGPRDLELLRTVANQAATALRNAASYRRVTELLASLESRVEERTRELQRTQAELRASNEKLREIDRVKTQFFSDASHELRTPLTLVLGPIEELRRRSAGLDDGTRRLVDLAHASAAKLLVLTDTLLDLSRADAGGMQPDCRPEPLAPLLERSAEPFRWAAEQRGVALALDTGARPDVAWCDARLLGKVVGNLLANALKFTVAGRIDLRLVGEPERIGIRVADTGPGIPAAELPAIFERYRQASTAQRSMLGGSGLGLALVRELTELQGGTVEVESEEGRGTTFTVWLRAGAAPPEDDRAPAAEAIAPVDLSALAAAGAARDRLETPPPNGVAGEERPSLLIVDDNPALLAFLHDLLAADYRVRCADGAEQALALLGAERPDLILSDVMMPGPDGIALCKRLKQDDDLRHVPLILLTARAAVESKISGLDAGADDYVTKPFHPEELKARMAALLRMRRMERDLARSNAELAAAYGELQSAQAQLVQAEKLAALGTLVAGVAHEINNPISFVSSSIDLICTSIAEVSEILDRHLGGNGGDGAALEALRGDLDYEYRIGMLRENAAICREGAERAARIVGDLRTFCRPGGGRREPTDLHASLEQCLRLLGAEFKGRIALHRQYGELPRVRCDGGQMSQVFLNLLVNAVQAIDGAGDVTVRTRREDGVVHVDIEDSGRGMAADTVARVFDPFFTTKEVGKGTGLGLSIVRSLVHAHGGDVAVRSAVGRGSVFTVTLPIEGAEHDPG